MTTPLDPGLRRILALDALTCAGAGLLMAGGSAVLAPVTGLPSALLLWAGLALFPVAALLAWLSRRAQAPAALAWLVVLGNAGWVAGSVLVLFAARPTFIGEAFVVGQALAVAVLTVLEFNGLRRASALSAA
jgi:hypothetical protein